MKVADKVGDYLKEIEGVEGSRAIPLGTVVLARLDGRSFHTFTKGLKRPYDERLSDLMVSTTVALLQELQANIGYTQSDEISLAWYFPATSCSGYPFGGRIQKLCSVLASCATAHFVRGVDKLIPEKSHLYPMFDCRVWPASREDAVATFKWREADARKNAISMAASSYFSHKDLQSVNSVTRIGMMRKAGVSFDDFPSFFKHGSYVYRQQVAMDSKDFEKIPEQYRPVGLTLRNVVKVGEVKSLNDLANAAGFLLDNEAPVYKSNSL